MSRFVTIAKNSAGDLVAIMIGRKGNKFPVEAAILRAIIAEPLKKAAPEDVGFRLELAEAAKPALDKLIEARASPNKDQDYEFWGKLFPDDYRMSRGLPQMAQQKIHPPSA